MCIHITDSLCCIEEINTTLQSNYTPRKINLKKEKKSDIVMYLICMAKGERL